MSHILNVDLVTTIFCHIATKMQQSKYNMFFKLFIQPVLDMVTTFCKIYHSMSFPCDAHTDRFYNYDLQLCTNVLFCLFYELYTKNLACYKNEIKTYILDCFAMIEQDESNQLNTVVTPFLQIPHKISPKGSGAHTFPHRGNIAFFPLTKFTTAFLYYSRLLQDSRLLPYRYSVANII